MKTKNIQIHKHFKRRGIAMMLVMVAVLVTGGMALAYFGSRDNSFSISTNVVSASQARIVAESGLDIAISILETNSDWRTSHIDGVIVENYEINSGKITISVLDSETSLPPTESTNKVIITVASSIDGRTQLTEANATIISDDDEIDVDYSEFAVFAKNQIIMTGASTISNWQASPMSTQQVVQIGTLATNPMAVKLESIMSSKNLQLRTIEDASSMISTSAVNTKFFADQPPFLNPPNPPSNPTPLSLDNQESGNYQSMDNWANWFGKNHQSNPLHFSKKIMVDSGSYIIDKLTLHSSKSIEIIGDVTMIVEDDFTMRYGNITLAKDATLTMHIGGDVNLKSSYIGNKNQSRNSWIDPSRVRIYGADNTNWKISGFSTLKSEIYAPKSNVELQGIAAVCGRIAAKDVLLSGASSVLYDHTLDQGGFADHESPIYDETGAISNEVRKLTQLDNSAIESIQNILFDNQAECNVIDNSWHALNWKQIPTERPHKVIYTLMVFGADARIWEERARQLRFKHYNTAAAWTDNQWN